MIIGWKFDCDQCVVLLVCYLLCYVEMVVDYVMFLVNYVGGVIVDLLELVVDVWIVGYVDDGQGVEVMIVVIDGLI